MDTFFLFQSVSLFVIVTWMYLKDKTVSLAKSRVSEGPRLTSPYNYDKINA